MAGEVSGDALGGDFMQKMNALHPNIRWVGVGGRSMAAQGLSSVIDMGRLSVMGLAEVMMHLPDLLKAKKQIITAFKAPRWFLCPICQPLDLGMARRSHSSHQSSDRLGIVLVSV